jgi:hypothetical protein
VPVHDDLVQGRAHRDTGGHVGGGGTGLVTLKRARHTVPTEKWAGGRGTAISWQDVPTEKWAGGRGTACRARPR